MIARALCLGCTCFFLFACSKPAQLSSPDQDLPKATPETENEPTFATAPPVTSDQPINQPTPEEVESPAETVATLQQKFFNTQDVNARSEVIYALGELNSSEAMAVLGSLFQNERDEKLKLDILITVQQMEVATAPKISILAAAVRSEQPQTVREEAIDALADLDEPGALPMLQILVTDPDPAIREAAKEALEDAEESKATPSP
jgi:HEAT repeat protein